MCCQMVQFQLRNILNCHARKEKIFCKPQKLFQNYALTMFVTCLGALTRPVIQTKNIAETELKKDMGCQIWQFQFTNILKLSRKRNNFVCKPHQEGRKEGSHQKSPLESKNLQEPDCFYNVLVPCSLASKIKHNYPPF